MASANSSEWTALARSVDAGELRLEPGAARACAQRCADLIEELVRMRRRAYQLKDVKGFGDLPSGRALAEKFSKKAVGGEYSMVQALTDHIAEAERMRAVFEKIEARYSVADQEVAAAIDGVGGEVH